MPYNAETQRKYRKKNAKKINAYFRAYFKKNGRKEYPETVAHYRARNADRIKVVEKAYREKHREERMRYASAYNKKRTESLSDAYVANQLKIELIDAPKVLIEAKRVQIMLRRAARR